MSDYTDIIVPDDDSYASDEDLKAVIEESLRDLDDTSSVHSEETMNTLSDIIPHLTSPVVLVTANMGYVKLVQNLLNSIDQVGTKPTVVLVCEDEIMYKYFQERQGVTVALTEFGKDITEEQEWLCDNFKDLAKRRIWHIYHLARAGIDTLYLDADTVWLQDPFPRLTGGFDIYVQQEENIPYCSGMFFIRATDPSLRMLTYWKEHVHEGEDLQDQETYNEAIKVTKNLKVKKLPAYEFVGGEIYFKSITPWYERPTKPVIVHATWRIGVENKRKTLKECGIWFAE
ncbi:uncharacterized protein [Apostichopus japonicus]